MQEDKRKNEGLVQRFQRVLGDLGIQVEVNEDGEGVEVTSNLERTRNESRNGAAAALGRYSRRNSFDSFFDGTADKVAGVEYGDLPVRPRGASHGGLTNGVGKDKHRRANSVTEAPSYQLPYRARRDWNGRRPSASGQQRTRGRSVSVSSRGSLQIRREDSIGPRHGGNYEEDESDYTDRTTSLDLSHVQVPGINAPIPNVGREPLQELHHFAPEPFRPSNTRLLDDAETFEQQRLHRITRRCMQSWRDRTAENLMRRADMEDVATAFDRKILLKLSFEQLRDTSRLQKSSRETDRFFVRLEERADRARNLFLLTKAFTHWAKSAEDEVQRTSVARRHILRTRFFNGWRDITAVNELKIQHFVLAKFMQTWRARTAAARETAEYAIALYEENLVRRVYREWFFKFCAIAAPAWRNDRTRKMTLQKMNEIAKVLHERQTWATDRYEQGLVKKMFKFWREKTIKNQALDQRADGFKRNVLVAGALQLLRKQAQLTPMLRRSQQMTDNRVTSKTFSGWQHSSQLHRQAREVDRLRVLRNAWTNWNDRLRIKALEDRVNDRILVECLYKWTLASRVSLFQRVHDRQQKETSFLSWVTQTNQRINTLDAAERRFAHFKRAQLLRLCLQKMEAITAERKAEEYAVSVDYEQKLRQRVFDKLKERQEHFQQLQQWSKDAHFYVLSTHTLKRWSEATQLSRRNRRRDAYTQFRRNVKTNLVQRLFVNWKSKADTATLLNEQAHEVLQNRVMRVGGALLHDWHDRTIKLRQQEVQAANVYSFKLGVRHFRIWTDRAEALQRMDSQAVALQQEGDELAATSALKKLGWKLWNIKRREDDARALYERNFEKHVRAILRFWLEQASEKAANGPISPTPTDRSRRSRRDDEDNDRNDEQRGRTSQHEARSLLGENIETETTQNIENWTTAFDANALGVNDDLDLSFSITPEQPRPQRLPPSSSRPLPSRSILRSTPARPHTVPQPQSLLRPPPQTIPEDSILDPAFAAGANDEDNDFGNPSTFWTGTPRYPPAASLLAQSKAKPGYLKTPSKRSVVRAKRPELPASPEKTDRVRSPIRRELGAMSAPPAQRRGDFGVGKGVKSFEDRLRDGGFGVAAERRKQTRSVFGRGRFGTGRGRGRGKVGFGDVEEMQ